MITFEALAFLLLGLFGGRMASGGFTGGYFSVHTEFMLAWQLSPVGFLVDVIAIVAFLGALWLAHRGWKAKEKYHYFLRASSLIIGVLFFFLIFGRLGYGTTYGSHDGLIQSEVAAQMLLHGKNPYAESFTGTAFGVYHPPKDGVIDPIVNYYAYPPLVIVLHLPVALWNMVTGWPMDGRVMTTGAYIVLVVLLLRLSKNLQYRTWVAIFFLANPFLIIYPVIGLNDIFFLVCIVGATLLARQKKWLVAGAILGLAIAAKQTAVVAIPLWAWWLWQETRQHRLTARKAWLSLAWTGGVAAALYLPFIIWNAPAMYEDLVRYVSGALPHTYPIGGDSLYQFLVMSQLVPDKWAVTKPFLGLLIAAIISLPIGLMWIRRRPKPSQFLTSLVFVTFIISLANRFFYENYVSSLVLLAAVALTLSWLETNEAVAPEGGRR